MKIADEDAKAVFRAEWTKALAMQADPKWVARIETLSALCVEGKASTHIAFLGTSILAKSVNSAVDLRAIKPTHAVGNSNAYSARTLCHSVLVPLAAELGVNIGVSGREPLNNQPYFRMTRLGDETPVSGGGRPAFDFMSLLIDDLQSCTAEEAAEALRAFILVRKRYQTVYAQPVGDIAIDWPSLSLVISNFVKEESEGGKRAQAIVAGLLDVFSGPAYVESGRINDPSRHYPGDVALRDEDGSWLKAIEVRDKPVSDSDIHIFGRTCLSKGVLEAAVVMASPLQKRLDDDALRSWASKLGLGLTLFYGLSDYVDQVLFWSKDPKPAATTNAVAFIAARLMGVEASSKAITSWHQLTRQQ